MHKTWAAAALTLVCALFLAANASTRLTLHAAREAPTDLEVGGDIPGLAPGTTGFLSYHELLSLPQAQSVYQDENFSSPVRIAGVPLDEIRRSLGSDAEGIVAICADGYHSHYSARYLSTHHPELVLTVNGQKQDDWPKVHGQIALGPYVIANPNFAPSFRVLSHAEQKQIPFQVVRLDFLNEDQVFGPIRPAGNYAPDSPVTQGYRIARENCYRCHNMGAEGGRMASVPWPVLASLAKTNPDFFAKYVRNPQAVNPRSRMEASPQYDDQTMAALEAYFATFAPGGK